MKYVILTIVIRREGDYYVSKCVELGTASFGSTKEEAVVRVRDAVELHLNTLEDLGECEAALKAKGIRVHQSDEAAAHEVKFPSRGSTVYSQVMPLRAAC